jgi:hypothetical protein
VLLIRITLMRILIRISACHFDADPVRSFQIKV